MEEKTLYFKDAHTILRPDIGKHFRCIWNDEIVIGKIQYQGSSFFLCQNVFEGHECFNKLGYRFSFDVASGINMQDWVDGFCIEATPPDWDEECN